MDALPPLPPGECITALLAEADRLGVDVRWQQQPEATANATEPSGTYVALPGKPGYMSLKAANQHPPTLSVCRLLAHEMVHVIQHWHGNFEAVLPLGWPIDKNVLPKAGLSPHEAEAFTAQWHPRWVIKAVRALKPQKDFSTNP